MANLILKLDGLNNLTRYALINSNPNIKPSQPVIDKGSTIS